MSFSKLQCCYCEGITLNYYNEPIVWCDVNTTGFVHGTDHVLELGLVVTNYRLDPRDWHEPGMSWVVHCADDVLAGMDDVAHYRHAQSGLLDQVKASRLTPAEAEEAALDYLLRLGVPPAPKVSVYSSSLRAGRGFLCVGLPLGLARLDAHLAYRQINVEAIKQLAARHRPDVYDTAPVKTRGHHILAAIAENIAELRHYQQLWSP